MSITITPASAAVPYSAFTPRTGIEISSAHHRIRFNTTADTRPTVASAKPASGPDTPDSVMRR